MSILDRIPREIFQEILSFLPVPDILSLSYTCKEYFSFLTSSKTEEPSYWQRRAEERGIKKKEWLSWLGTCFSDDAQKGAIGYGSENFTSIFLCLDEAYRRGDNKLLTYFLRILLREKRMAYHRLSEYGSWVYPCGANVSNLLLRTLMDSREDTFLSLLGEINRRSVKSLPLYILAKNKDLHRAQRELLPEGVASLEWFIYAIQTKDRLIFQHLYPRLENGGKRQGQVHALLDIYSWPEVKPLLTPSVKSITLTQRDISWDTQMVPLMEPVGFQYADFIPSGIINSILTYDHEKAREIINKEGGLSSRLVKECFSHFPRGDTSRDQYELMNVIQGSIYYLTAPSLRP